ncbi:MAG: peptide deformylase [bacterium]
MAIRKVIQIGDPRLKNKNKIITDFYDKNLQALICDLRDTLNEGDLVGIAAPQIGENYCVFVTYPRNTKARNIGRDDIFRVYINPKITLFSHEQVIIYEGCGSVVKGQLFGPVIRPKEVKIEAYDEKGKKFEITTDGLLARVIQHEYDHMFGVEFTEKISDYRKLLSQVFYKKYIRNTEETKKLLNITKLEYKSL